MRNATESVLTIAEAARTAQERPDCARKYPGPDPYFNRRIASVTRTKPESRMSSTIATMRLGSAIEGIRDSRNGATILNAARSGIGNTTQVTRRKGKIATRPDSSKDTGSRGGAGVPGAFTNRGTMNHARTSRAYPASATWRYRSDRLMSITEAPSVLS